MIFARVSSAFLAVSLSLFLGQSQGASGQTKPDDRSGTAALRAAAKSVTQQAYLLRHQFESGEEVRWRVKHVAQHVTKIQGNEQTSKSSSNSVKLWKIQSVDADGKITFEHSIEDVEMWQQTDDRERVFYSSLDPKKPPLEYEQVAETVGIPLATIVIDAQGNIISKKALYEKHDMGLGEVAMPLPPQAVKIGDTWYTPGELTANAQDGSIKRIKTRKRFTLESVKHGVANIAAKTELLTPIHDAGIKAQIAQQITNEKIKFDIDAGRMLSRMAHWNERVVGFSGADSMMHHQADFSESITTKAAAKAHATATAPAKIRSLDDAPVFLR